MVRLEPDATKKNSTFAIVMREREFISQLLITNYQLPIIKSKVVLVPVFSFSLLVFSFSLFYNNLQKL